MILLDLIKLCVCSQYIYVIDEDGNEVFSGVVDNIPMGQTRRRITKIMSEVANKGSELIIWTTR